MVYHAFHLTSKDWLLLTPLNFNTQSNEGNWKALTGKKRMIIRILPRNALKGQKLSARGSAPGKLDGNGRPERAKE